MNSNSSNSSNIEQLNELREFLVNSGMTSHLLSKDSFSTDELLTSLDEAIEALTLQSKHPLLMDLSFTDGQAVGMMKAMMNSFETQAKQAVEHVTSTGGQEPTRSADELIKIYALTNGLDPVEEFDSAAKDLITDTLHSLNDRNIDPDFILDGARAMFQEEVEEQENQSTASPS